MPPCFWLTGRLFLIPAFCTFYFLLGLPDFPLEETRSTLYKVTSLAILKDPALASKGRSKNSTSFWHPCSFSSLGTSLSWSTVFLALGNLDKMIFMVTQGLALSKHSFDLAHILVLVISQGLLQALGIQRRTQQTIPAFMDLTRTHKVNFIVCQ